MDGTHGSEKEFELDDPMELQAHVVDGEVRVLARSLIDEFIQLGYGREELLDLFRDPNYRMMNMVWTAEGESVVREIIDDVFSSYQAWRPPA